MNESIEQVLRRITISEMKEEPEEVEPKVENKKAADLVTLR